MHSRPMRAALILSAIAALGAPPVGAVCQTMPGQVENLDLADVVFVGTVRKTSERDREAIVTVHESWHGPNLPVDVTVRGYAGGPGSLSSIDRTYETGRRYLFAVDLVDGQLRDNACSATQLWRPALRGAAPAAPQLPIETGASLDDRMSEWVPAAAAVIALGALLGFGVIGTRWLREPGPE